MHDKRSGLDAGRWGMMMIMMMIVTCVHSSLFSVLANLTVEHDFDKREQALTKVSLNGQILPGEGEGRGRTWHTFPLE